MKILYSLAVVATIFHLSWPLLAIFVFEHIAHVKNLSFSRVFVFVTCVLVVMPIVLISQWLYSWECPLTEIEKILWYLADSSSELVLKSELTLHLVAAHGLEYAPLFILGTVTLVFLAVTVPVLGITLVMFSYCQRAFQPQIRG